MPRPTLLAILGIALITTTTGCATAPSPRRPGTPAIRQVRLAELPQQPAHDDASIALPGVANPEDAPGIAAHEIATRLLIQGLETVDIGTAVLHQSPDRMVVRVWVVFDATGIEHDSTYDVALRRDPQGWHLDDTNGGR